MLASNSILLYGLMRKIQDDVSIIEIANFSYMKTMFDYLKKLLRRPYRVNVLGINYIKNYRLAETIAVY